MSEKYCVITFDTVQQSLVFEKHLIENEIAVKLMPVPRQLSSSCGTAAYVDCKDKEKIQSLCKESSILFDEFHELYQDKKNMWFLNHLKK
ncbi:MAG: DUF3343 domain-containing protein [Tissierellia bacterium]|jgi:hypothetical protein|nr:DUF3343 domain-containing protein [Tissierellia bacterium]